MKIAVLGSGAREHALQRRLSEEGATVRVLPGNAGTGAEEPLDLSDGDAVIARCAGADLVVIGPEQPLAAGLADRLRAAGLPVLGPGTAGARLESSKTWAREFAARHGIPAPRWRRAEDPGGARALLPDGPVVLKYDGLAAGKGVWVCADRAEAEAALVTFEARYGACPLLVEERCVGPEVSVFALTDGRTWRLLPSARDHKALLEGDLGPNTGGMGAVSPAPALDARDLDAIVEQLVRPTVAGLGDENIDYRGFIYFGLMLTAAGPRLLEFNARLGDPEAQVVLPGTQGPLAENLLAAALGALDRAPPLSTRPGWRVGITLARAGYPGPVGPPVPLTLPPVWRYDHGGTEQIEGALAAKGGRVLTALGDADTLEGARAEALAAAEAAQFQGKVYRRDIGRTGPQPA